MEGEAERDAAGGEDIEEWVAPEMFSVVAPHAAVVAGHGAVDRPPGAAADSVADGGAGVVVDLEPGLVDAAAEVDVFDAEEVGGVEGSDGLEGAPMEEHEGAGDPVDGAGVVVVPIGHEVLA